MKKKQFACRSCMKVTSTTNREVLKSGKCYKCRLKEGVRK